jgi:beta-glucosidase
MPIEHTALHPGSGSGYELTVEYINNKDFDGTLMFTRTDCGISFNWVKVVPVAGLQRNNHSVRLSGTFTLPVPCEYKLEARIKCYYVCENEEGFRLYPDGKLLVASHERGTTERGAVPRKRSTSVTRSHIKFAWINSTALAAPASTLRSGHRRRCCGMTQ